MTVSHKRFGFLTETLVAVVVVSLLGIWMTRPEVGPGPLGRAGIRTTAADTTPALEANQELDGQAEGVQQRVEAWQEALRQGHAGQARKRDYLKGAAAPATTGWVGEVPIDTMVDDWEPAIAADPHSPYVYLLTTRYGTAKPCPGNCPTPYIALVVSQDGGATWSPSRPLCACKGSGQFDPIIEVVPNTGDVYALFMIGFNVWFTKSTDHGGTWTAPAPIYGTVAWNDKPVIAMSDDGRDVYASFNGPTGGDPWVAQSHDGGVAWTQVKLVNSDHYIYAFDADVDSNGIVFFSESGLVYSSAGKHSSLIGGVDEHVFISRDQGRTWEDHIVAQTQPGITCVAVGCKSDFYQGHAVVSADGNGDLVYLYDGATVAGGLQSIYASRSTNGGATWAPPVAVSKAGEEATAPMIESRGNGDVRIAWMETSGGGNVDAWNTMYRRSSDGGLTWSTPVRISDATSGAVYKSAAGYAEVYGDYGEMGITNQGRSIATWGEGINYTGPGGVWVNRER
jgi:hypothetical protein